MMRSCFLHLVFIFWHSFLMVVGEEASECDNTQLSCEMLRVEPGVEDSDEQTCISRVENDTEDFTLGIGQELTFTCTWTYDQTASAVFKWNLIVSSGWRVLLRVNARREFKVEAGDTSDGDISEDYPVQSNTEGTVYQKFDSTDHRFFRNVDHFISRKSTLWIRASINDDRKGEVNTLGFMETFDVIARAVQVEDTIYTKASSCVEGPMGAWNESGFYAAGSSSVGSLTVHCDISMFHQGFLTSLYYMLDVNSRSPPYHESGSIQFESMKSRNLTLNSQGAISLDLTVSISQCDSFWIRFEARGDINLIISNVTVQGLIYDDKQDKEAACQPETSEPDPSFSQSSESSSSSFSSSSTYTTVSTSLVTLSSTTSITMTTSDDKISSTRANATLVDSSTPSNEKQVSRGTPSFLIPTVSVVAIFLLVSIAVLFICWKKRYRKRQSGNRDSVLSEDDERHEYCDVVPSGKPSSNETTYDFADPSSAENGSGIKNASKDERTANDSHAADESESPYAENGVLIKGQGYVMVDMGKKASQHQEKPKTSDNTGNDLEKDDHGIDEVKRSPTKNKVIVNGPEYAVVDMEKKASQRKEKAKISLNRGKNHPGGEHCMDQGESSTEKPKVFMNGQEYAVVDMEKKALERKGKSKMGRSDEKHLETNDDETYFTLEPDASPEDKDGQTNQTNVKSPSGMDTADIHKTPEGESDYDEPRPFGSSSAEQYDELQFNPSVSDLSKKSDNQAKGESTDDTAEAYQTVSASTSPVSSMRPDSYPPSDYEAMSPPTSPGVILTGTDGQYPSSDNKTGGSLRAAAVEPVHRPLDTYQLVVQDQTSGNRDSSASHTYEDPAVMAEALERPYDKLQRGSDRNKPLATQKTISAADKEVAAMANHEDALNVYDEIATANTTLKEADESSGAYQHLQRPLTKRSKAREPLPAIPGDEGYGRLNLEDNGTSSHTNAAAHEERESGDSATKDDGPTYATVENPSEAYRPDDDDPAYDLLGTLK